MIILSVATIFGLILCALAYHANARFRGENRLPMQWLLNGEVTWSAPRRLALMFIPALGIGVLSMFVILSLTLKPRPGQEALVLPTLIFLGTLFVAIQLAHIWMIAKTIGRNAD